MVISQEDGCGRRLADVVRDEGGHPGAIERLTFVLDLMSFGVRAHSSHSQSPVGAIDLSTDGTKLLAIIYDDIWGIDLK